MSPAKSASKIWIVGLIVVLVAGLAAVIATRDSGKDDKASDTTTAPSCSADAGAALPPFETAENDAAVCRTIPTVSGTTLDGKPITIGAADGKAKVIIFVAHWCPHCRREVPLIAAHLKETPMPSDVELLTVSTSVQSTAPNYPPKPWLDQAGWTAPVLADTDNSAALAYGLQAFPYFVVADAKGKVVVRASGELTTDQFDALVEAARTGKSPV